MTSNYTVTVLGLGAMGLPMATRLASQLTVHGFDIAEPRLKLAEEAGVATFGSAREAAKGAEDAKESETERDDDHESE